MIVIRQVETVFELGLRVLGICVETHSCIHHLAVVLPGLDVLDSLLESGQGTERVDDDLSGIGIRPQEELALGDVTGVVRDGVGDVSVVEGRHGDDGDGTLRRKLYGLLVDLREV